VGKEIPKGVMVYRMMGAFFFGAADKLESALRREKQEPDVLILRMRKVVAMDATGLNALEDLCERLQAKGKHLILSAPHTQPLMVMERAGFIDSLGRQNVCPHVDAALARARELLHLPPAPPSDPHVEERQKLEAARRELTGALARVNEVLKSSSTNNSTSGLARGGESNSVKTETRG
jgi:SulP family sulfate permease